MSSVSYPRPGSPVIGGFAKQPHQGIYPSSVNVFTLVEYGKTWVLYTAYRTNFLAGSDDLRVPAWAKGITTAPSATRLSEQALTNLHYVDQVIQVADNDYIYFSADVEKSVTRDVYIRFRGRSVADAGARFELATGNITNLGAGVTASAVASEDPNWLTLNVAMNVGSGVANGPDTRVHVRICKPGTAYTATYLGDVAEGINIKRMDAVKVVGRHIPTTTTPRSVLDVYYDYITGIARIADASTNLAADGRPCCGNGTTWRVPPI